MHETELWITRLFNDHLAGVGQCRYWAFSGCTSAAPMG